MQFYPGFSDESSRKHTHTFYFIALSDYRLIFTSAGWEFFKVIILNASHFLVVRPAYCALYHICLSWFVAITSSNIIKIRKT